MEPKYFVTSNGDSPDAIFFSFVEAAKSEATYIDASNDQGKHVGAWKWNSPGYTQDF